MTAAEFAKADLDDILARLSVEDAVKLLSGVGFWRTHAVPKLGIPSIKVFFFRAPV
jgi:beta-glucosidase